MNIHDDGDNQKILFEIDQKSFKALVDAGLVVSHTNPADHVEVPDVQLVQLGIQWI